METLHTLRNQIALAREKRKESVRVVAVSLTITTMECSFALTGKDYVLIAADTTASRSIVKMKVDEDKIKTLSPHLLMAYSGESGSSTCPIPILPKLTTLDFSTYALIDSCR